MQPLSRKRCVTSRSKHRIVTQRFQLTCCNWHAMNCVPLCYSWYDWCPNLITKMDAVQWPWLVHPLNWYRWFSKQSNFNFLAPTIQIDARHCTLWIWNDAQHVSVITSLYMRCHSTCWNNINTRTINWQHLISSIHNQTRIYIYKQLAVCNTFVYMFIYIPKTYSKSK